MAKSKSTATVSKAVTKSTSFAKQTKVNPPKAIKPTPIKSQDVKPPTRQDREVPIDTGAAAESVTRPPSLPGMNAAKQASFEGHNMSNNVTFCNSFIGVRAANAICGELVGEQEKQAIDPVTAAYIGAGGMSALGVRHVGEKFRDLVSNKADDLLLLERAKRNKKLLALGRGGALLAGAAAAGALAHKMMGKEEAEPATVNVIK
jgi:hypothetical protein